jgi:hypothetical protein
MDGLNKKYRWKFEREGMLVRTGIEIWKVQFASICVNVNYVNVN